MTLRIITLITSFVYCLAEIPAQTILHADHTGDEIAGNVVSTGSRIFYLSKSQEFPGCCAHARLHLKAMDKKGSALFDIPLQDFIIQDFHLAVTPDHHLLIMSSTKFWQCDVASELLYVCKFDTLGNKIWSFKRNEHARKIIPTGQNSFLLMSTDKLCSYSDSTLTDTIFLGNKIVDATLHGSSGILISYSTTSGYLRWTDLQGNTLKQSATAGTLGSLHGGQHGITGISAGNLHRYDSALSLAANSATAITSTWDIRSFSGYGNSVIVTAKVNNDQLGLLMLDTNFVPTQSIVTNLRNFNSAGICVTPDGTIGITGTGVAKHQYAAVLLLPGLSNPVLQKDIGVSSVHIASATNTLSGTMPTALLDANVVVKNYGTDTVHSFRLQHYSYNYRPPSSCLLGLNKLYLETLAPGDSLTVQTGSFIANTALDGNGLASMTICITTSVPDFEVDNDILNDEFCAIAKFQLTGLKDFPKNAAKVYPNPFNDRLNIEPEGTVRKVTLLDLTGRTVRSYLLQVNEKTVRPDLAAGSYIIRIETDSGASVTKLLATN